MGTVSAAATAAAIEFTLTGAGLTAVGVPLGYGKRAQELGELGWFAAGADCGRNILVVIASEDLGDASA